MTNDTDTVGLQRNADRELDYEQSTVGELRRIGVAGTVWFAASIVALGIVLDGLLSSGWRPNDLPLLAEVIWWLGAAVTAIGVFGFAWSGCPVWGWGPEVSLRQKSITIRGGVAFFLAGVVLSSVALFSVPA